MTGSVIAWLDTSADEQRRVREIVRLFSQRDTQDELGGRRIVVALSNALFPGTSVLQSRARYVLFIPWFAEIAASKKDAAGWFEWLEREMIARFLEDDSVPDADRLAGLIGSRAGPQVQTLPSTAYWSALETWEILSVPGTVFDTLHRMGARRRRSTPDEADELAARQIGVWHPGVGEPPDGFPSETIDGGFRLKPSEATWLQERWFRAGRGSLLAHLVGEQAALSGSWAPWLEPACRSADPAVTVVLDDAERFSLALGGARWVYHLLLAERYVERGFDRVDVDVDDIRAELDVWADEAVERAHLFDGWEPAAFWERVLDLNARIDPISRRFFDIWFDRIRTGDVRGIADDSNLRTTVEDRERFLKRGQARLSNDKLLAGWQGGAPGRVVFRWDQVSQLVDDVLQGLTDAGT